MRPSVTHYTPNDDCFSGNSYLSTITVFMIICHCLLYPFEIVRNNACYDSVES